MRVRHSGDAIPLSVAGRTRVRPRAVRAYMEAPLRIDPGLASPSSPYRHRVQHREIQWESLLDVLVAHCRRTTVNHAGFCRGPAHVEGDDILVTENLAHLCRPDHSGGGPALDHQGTVLLGHFRSHQTSARLHYHESTFQPNICEALLHVVQVGAYPWFEVGGYRRRGEPLVFERLWNDVGARDHCDMRPLSIYDLLDSLLIRRVYPGIQAGCHEYLRAPV